MKKIILWAILLHSSFVFSQDGSKDGDWMSVGIPKFVHMSTQGEFLLNGTEHGKCAGTKPKYFTFNMDDKHFSEFYSWVLFMAAQKKPLTCIADSGCGTSKVLVRFCRGMI